MISKNFFFCMSKRSALRSMLTFIFIIIDWFLLIWVDGHPIIWAYKVFEWIHLYIRLLFFLIWLFKYLLNIIFGLFLMKFRRWIAVLFTLFVWLLWLWFWLCKCTIPVTFTIPWIIFHIVYQYTWLKFNSSQCFHFKCPHNPHICISHIW